MEETSENSSTVSSVESGEESKFAAVVFHNVQEIYIPRKDIRCCYSIKPSVSPTSSDWIGLFKVGWQSYKDYLCYEYSPVVDNSAASRTASFSLQRSVLFRGDRLPTEENEFYQFCYVTSSGEIRGASYPFQIQFSKPGQLECNEEEDENGDTLLIVMNRTTMLEDSLAKAYEENSVLKASREKVEADCFSFQDMILKLESQKNKMHACLIENKKTVEEVTSEKQKAEESLKETVEKVKHSEQSLREARAKIQELQKSLEVEKLRAVQADGKKKLEEERMELLQVISDGECAVDRLNAVVDEKNSDIQALEEKMRKTLEENKALVKEHDSMLCEINTTKVLLNKAKQENLALEKSLAEQHEHMNILKKESCKLKEKLTATDDEMDQLSTSFNQDRDLVHKTHLKEISCLEKQTEALMNELHENKRAVDVTEEKIHEIGCELEQEKAMHQQVVQEFEDLITIIQEQLNQERAFNSSLSTASDRQVAELQEQLNIQLERNSTACQQIDLKTQEIKRLEEDMKAKERVIASMEQLIDEGKQELQSSKSLQQEYLQSKENKAEKNSGLEGPYFALQKAHAHLKKQNLEAKADMKNLWRQKSDLRRQLTILQSELPDSDLRFQMATLKKQIEDLRIRLNMGAEAYKEKFKECRKYQNQLSKVQKNVSGQTPPQSPSSVSEIEVRNLKQSLENEKTSVVEIKKSLENYKNDSCEAKQELEEVKKETESLRRKVDELEEEAIETKKEKEKRLAEDKELQSHIERLHCEVEARRESAEEKESVISTLSEKNQSLQDAMEKNQEAHIKVLNERDVLQEEIVRHKKAVEDLSTRLQEKKDSEATLLQRTRDLEPNPDDTSRAEDIASARPPLDDSSSQEDPALTSTSNENICPICSIYFPPNCPPDDFSQHVNTHFSD